MKNFFSAILVMIISTTAVLSDNATLSERIQNPVFIVLTENNDAFNNAVKIAVENNWSISNYAFISHEEYKEVKRTSENLFIMLIENESVDGSSYTYPYVLESFYITRGSYRYNVSGAPLLNVSNESMHAEVFNGIRLLQDKLSFKIASETKETEFVSFNDAVRSRTSIVKMKKLYISEEDLDKNILTIDAIKNIYNGEVIIVSNEELAEIVQSNTDVLYVTVNNFKNGLGYTNFKQVIDAGTGSVMYNNEIKSVKPLAFNKSDFESLK
ncbi:MAG: hypothetical protein H7Y00_08485 [Fimbriimonadaceae bacterium]|nr:hypothetical protein [Chitinophagales bacterium]